MSRLIFLIFAFSLIFLSSNYFPAKASLSSADIIIELSEIKDLNTNSMVIVNGVIAGKIGFVANKDNKNLVGLNLNKKSLNSLNHSTIAIIKSPMTIKPEFRQTTIELITPEDKNGELPSKIKGFCSFQEFWSADLGKKSSIYEAKI